MLNKFSIAQRLALGFGIVLALLLAVAFSGYWGMESVTNETISMLHGDQAISQKSDEVKIDTLQLRRFEKDIVLNLDSPSKMRDYQDKWRGQLTELKNDTFDLESLPLTAEEKQLVTEMKNDMAVYERGVDAVAGAITAGT